MRVRIAPFGKRTGGAVGKTAHRAPAAPAERWDARPMIARRSQVDDRRMTKHRIAQALVGIAALIGTTLAGIINAAPAAACIGDCGTIDGQFWMNPGSSASYGYPVTLEGYVFDANVECGGGSAPPQICDTPTGTIKLSYDGIGFATVDLIEVDFAEARFEEITYSGTPAGTHEFVAEYNGNFDSPSRWTVEQYSIAPAETVVTLQQSTASTVTGQTFTVTATVAPYDPGAIDLAHGAHLPTGTVEFYDGGTLLGAKVLDGQQQASADIALTGVLSHDVYARYVGDGDYEQSWSLALQHTVTKGDSTIRLSIPPTPSVYGQELTFFGDAVPTPPAGSDPPFLTGFMEFQESGTGTIASTNGDNLGVTYPSAFPLSVGEHDFRFVWSGDANFNGSTSPIITHTVSKADTNTTLAATTPNPSNVGEAVTLSASVAVVSPGAGTPTGAVQFYAGTAPLGTPTALSGNTAALAVSGLAGGTHTITARYLGDGNFNPSASNPWSHTVRCDRVITHVAGEYDVPASGTTCITGKIGGGLDIPAGATVSVVGATIGGELNATGARALVVCGTHVGAELNVTRAKATVVIGSPSQACAANSVNGGLRVAGTTGGETVIGGNRIGGWLECNNNTPAATNGGDANTAAGRKGECAAPGF